MKPTDIEKVVVSFAIQYQYTNTVFALGRLSVLTKLAQLFIWFTLSLCQSVRLVMDVAKVVVSFAIQYQYNNTVFALGKLSVLTKLAQLFIWPTLSLRRPAGYPAKRRWWSPTPYS